MELSDIKHLKDTFYSALESAMRPVPDLMRRASESGMPYGPLVSQEIGENAKLLNSASINVLRGLNKLIINIQAAQTVLQHRPGANLVPASCEGVINQVFSDASINQLKTVISDFGEISAIPVDNLMSAVDLISNHIGNRPAQEIYTEATTEMPRMVMAMG